MDKKDLQIQYENLSNQYDVLIDNLYNTIQRSKRISKNEILIDNIQIDMEEFSNIVCSTLDEAIKVLKEKNQILKNIGEKG